MKNESAAAGSPRDPEFEYYDQYPRTSNDPDVNARVTAAFTAHFGPDAVQHAKRAPASEDFSRLPDAFGMPYTYCTVGSTPSDVYRDAVANGTVAQDIPANHSPFFAPAIDPTLGMATEAHVVAALSYLSDVK